MEIRGRGQNDKPQHRVNEQIRAASVRVVGENVEAGVYPLKEALAMAEAAGADLVEISPNADPPVCRIIDYSKFLYQLKKKQKRLKAKSVKVVVKEIRFGPQTDDHDFNFKLKHAIRVPARGCEGEEPTCSSKGVRFCLKIRGLTFGTLCQCVGRLRETGIRSHA